MNEETPIQLIQRIVYKDGKAFERFYDRFAPLVYTAAIRILRSPQEAEETLQDVFYAAWKNAGRYDPNRGKVETWLMAITRSRAIDRLRSVRRKSANVEPLSENAETDVSALTEEKASKASDARLTAEGILAEISEAQRQVLELAYFAGFTQSEIAVRLDLPIGTVKTRMRDGLKRLKELLEKKERTGERHGA